MKLQFRRRVLALITCASIFSNLAPVAHAAPETSISSGKFRSATQAYLSNFVINSGEALTAHVVCPTKDFTAQVFRIGDYGVKEYQLVWDAKYQPCHKVTKNFLAWPENLSITENFAPGLYVFRIFDQKDYAAYATFIVRNQNPAKVVASIPFLTLLAYNKVNGSNAYKSPTGFMGRAKEISFASPIDYKSGLDKFAEYVFPVVREIEKLHLDVSYVADYEINDDPTLLDNRTEFISMGHDEYWTDKERSAVLAAREHGTNLVFLGANVAYWNVRVSPAGTGPRTLSIYKSKALDPDTSNPSILFSALGKPESQLTGLDYTCFPAHGNLQIKEPNSFIFAGATTPSVSQLATLVGPEVDQVRPHYNRFSGRLQILAEAKVSCGGITHQVYGYSHFIYGLSANQAGTISLGSMAWTSVGLRALATSPVGAFARTVTDNILSAAAVGPLGATHPF